MSKAGGDGFVNWRLQALDSEGAGGGIIGDFSEKKINNTYKNERIKYFLPVSLLVKVIQLIPIVQWHLDRDRFS